MEAFQLLSRGGVKFDKKRFKPDVQLFQKNGESSSREPILKDTTSQALPTGLDFFKYAEGGQGKRKTFDKDGPREVKRVKSEKTRGHESDEDNEDEEGVENGRAGSNPPTQQHRISVKGLNQPKEAVTFEALKERYPVPPHLYANLAKNDYLYPTGIQSSGIPVLLESRDLAAISPTGTGKTLSYLFPIFSKLGSPAASQQAQAAASGTGVRAIVIAPTRELAHQIHNECLKLAEGRKWRIVLFSKATASTLSEKSVRDKVDMIISTPLRLIAAIQEGSLGLGNVRHLILDEADRLLDTEFLEQIEEITAACTHPNIQKAMFSATLPAGVEKIAMRMLQDPIRLVVGLKDTPLPLIAQSMTYVADDASKLPSLLAYLSQPYNPPVLIFTSTQPRASSLAEELTMHGIRNVDCLHGGITKKEREDAISRMRRGDTWILISTEVMARGMDFKGVLEVINYDFPTSVQSYIHRIGRTGRAGREGKAVTFFTDEDGPFLKSIANVILQSGSTVPEWMLKLPKPSKMKRRQMGKVKRPEVVNSVRRVGRREAVKKREMITGSKRRAAKATQRHPIRKE